MKPRKVGPCGLILYLLYLSLSPNLIVGQSGSVPLIPATPESDESLRTNEQNLRQSERDTFAMSVLTSLANEARGYTDLTLRTRVLARAADVLWDADSTMGRTLFRRAWEAAEQGDFEEVTVKTKDKPPPMVIALRRMSGRDLRSEVLSFVIPRDRELGKEFLSKLTTRTDKDAESRRGSGNGAGWSSSDLELKRLQIARKLLANGQAERALEFAGPSLGRVNANSIAFLSELRVLNPQVADEIFSLLLTSVQIDPTSDSNTVSGLSSYAFSPGFYITFKREGGATWTQSDQYMEPPNLSPTLREKFFTVSASILLRPLPSPDQDFSSAGLLGKLMVIRRLLPLFDQFAPDAATALRAHMTGLTGQPSSSRTVNENPLLSEGLKRESAVDVLQQMQDRLDHAKTTRERDEIYVAGAVALAAAEDGRAREIAGKIDDGERRLQTRQFVDFHFVQSAIRRKQQVAAIRLAESGQLNNTQRALAYAQIARLVLGSNRQYAIQLLQNSIDEANRIDASPNDRATVLLCVAQQMFTADRDRTWVVLDAAIKAANLTEDFTGEKVFRFSLPTRNGIKTITVGGDDFSLSRMFELLAEGDLYRSVSLARDFKNVAPRAFATLAIAKAILEKRSQQMVAT